MNTLIKLQDWYLSQCNEVWEHSYGVSIETLDNPGWMLTVDLADTSLDGFTFPEHSYNLDEISDNEWLHCKVENNKFIAAGGPAKLEEMINVFLVWANSAT